MLIKGEPNISYICSRYYRAPELIFGATDYTSAIDVWSVGCVVAELLLGQPLFPGESGVDQLVEIIKVLGTPSREEIHAMNPNYTEFKFPQIKAHPWTKVFSKRMPPDAVDLVRTRGGDVGTEGREGGNERGRKGGECGAGRQVSAGRAVPMVGGAAAPSLQPARRPTAAALAGARPVAAPLRRCPSCCSTRRRSA